MGTEATMNVYILMAPRASSKTDFIVGRRTRKFVFNSIPMKKKRCSKCGVPKPHSEFWKDSKASDGYVASCKDCKRGGLTKKLNSPDYEAIYDSRNRLTYSNADLFYDAVLAIFVDRNPSIEEVEGKVKA